MAYGLSSVLRFLPASMREPMQQGLSQFYRGRSRVQSASISASRLSRAAGRVAEETSKVVAALKAVEIFIERFVGAAPRKGIGRIVACVGSHGGSPALIPFTGRTRGSNGTWTKLPTGDSLTDWKVGPTSKWRYLPYGLG